MSLPSRGIYIQYHTINPLFNFHDLLEINIQPGRMIKNIQSIASMLEPAKEDKESSLEKDEA